VKPLVLTKILSLAIVLFSGYIFADVAHPENPDIVGGVFDNKVCFNADGVVEEVAECDGLDTDAGKLSLGIGQWAGSSPSGINGCGTTAVSPVSSATCPYYASTTFAGCQVGKYVLVQTTDSVGYYWAVLAEPDCLFLDAPETLILMPCRASDAFDPDTGCATVNPPVISVEDGYIKAGSGRAPPPTDCSDDTHTGRMFVDGVNQQLYTCTHSGWTSTDVAAKPGEPDIRTGLYNRWIEDGTLNDLQLAANHLVVAKGSVSQVTFHPWGPGQEPMQFDVTGSYLKASQPMSLSAGHTISAWVLAKTLSPTPLTILNFGSTLSDADFHGLSIGTSGAFTYRRGAPPAFLFELYNSGPTITPDTWYMVTVTETGYPDYISSLYVNGEWQVADQDAFAIPTGDAENLTIGAIVKSGTPGDFFPGQIRSVRTYTRTLTPGEVRALFEATRPK